jgi:hypothetical protein|tara:strand:+ start:5632 stop:6099 length:468 start_codon:yes stop_codon:yes gene_type:complete
MGIKKTNRGVVIDFDAMQASQGNRSAVGNMRTDGQGNVLGPGGVIVETNEQRVRKYLKDNPVISEHNVTLAVDDPMDMNVEGAGVVESKTAKTEAENVRTAKPKAKKVQPDPEPAPVAQPSEFDEPELEPLGYNEVMQDNGDIEMVPYYVEADKA